MQELAQAQCESRFETGDSKGSAVEFDVLARRVMRRVVGGDGVHAAVGQAFDERGAIFARSERRIHFVMRIVADVFVNEREMMRRNFAGDRQTLFFCSSHIFE